MRIEPSAALGEPVRLSALFTDSAGVVSLMIVNNEWRAPSNRWDIEVVGNRLTIREKAREIALVLRVDPPHSLTVERLHMSVGRFKLRGDTNSLEVFFQGRLAASVSGGEVYGVQVGLHVSPRPAP